jgi:hypothetical protein
VDIGLARWNPQIRGRKGNSRAMTFTQLPDLQRSFPTDIRKPVNDGVNACRVMNSFVGI